MIFQVMGDQLCLFCHIKSYILIIIKLTQLCISVLVPCLNFLEYSIVYVRLQYMESMHYLLTNKKIAQSCIYGGSDAKVK